MNWDLLDERKHFATKGSTIHLFWMHIYLGGIIGRIIIKRADLRLFGCI